MFSWQSIVQFKKLTISVFAKGTRFNIILQLGEYHDVDELCGFYVGVNSCGSGLR